MSARLRGLPTLAMLSLALAAACGEEAAVRSSPGANGGAGALDCGSGLFEVGHYDFVNALPGSASLQEAKEEFLRDQRRDLPAEGWRIRNETERAAEFVYERHGRVLGRLAAARNQHGWVIYQVEVCEALGD